MRRIVVLTTMLPLLAACAGQPDGWSRAMDYSWDVATVTVGGDTWRVLEHPGNGPAGGRIMTTPSIARAAGIGAAQGATFGAVSGEPPIERHRAAARARLDATGRAACRIVDGYELIKLQYEFVFTCAR